MMGRVWKVAVVSILAFGCDKETSDAPAGPPPTATCAHDSDCVLVGAAPPRCCTRCSPQAMTTSQAAAANAQCQKITAGDKNYFDRCPHLDCPCERATAKCQNQACVVETAPCN